ncbi:MAG: hypothetical protein ACR2RE_16870 [Geminicoccaceae bacterium]
MTKHHVATELLDQTLGGHDLNDAAVSAAMEAEIRVDRRHLRSILAFFGREIDQSSTILRDLAEQLSHELCALGQATDMEAIGPGLAASTVALQSEDRIQQRLGDMRTALSILEQTLALGDSLNEADLNLTIIEQLRLEEMRYAFALGLDITDQLQRLSKPAKAPTLGDVDLF